jgi:hypothetical protein
MRMDVNAIWLAETQTGTSKLSHSEAAVIFPVVQVDDGKRTALHSDLAVLHDHRIRPIVDPIGRETHRMRRIGPALKVLLCDDVG